MNVGFRGELSNGDRFIAVYDSRRSAQRTESRPGARSLAFWFTPATTTVAAMAVGAGLAFVEVNIYSTATAIGLATMTMATIMLGHVIGRVAGFGLFLCFQAYALFRRGIIERSGSRFDKHAIVPVDECGCSETDAWLRPSLSR